MGERYDVFISYRHKPLDNIMVKNTFNMLESYRMPRALADKGYKGIKRVFRDTEELAVSRVLTDTILKALDDAQCLIITCSVDTPSSEWVDREVATFIEMGKSQNIYPLLISGNPETSFPPSLKLVPDIMDRVMDVRDRSMNPKKMLQKEETELLKVIAGVSGCKYDILLREHKLRKSRRVTSKAVSSAAVFAFVTLVSLGFWNKAEAYREGAREEQSKSMLMLNKLTYELPDNLVGFPGTYSRVAEILTENTKQINSILDLAEDKDAVEGEIASNYEKLSTAYTTLGKYEEAADWENIALDIYSARAEKDIPGSDTDLASAYNNMGRLLNTSGKYEEADDFYEKAVALCPTEKDTLALRASMLCNRGANYADMGNFEASAKAFNESTALFESISRDTVNREYSDCVYNYGVTLLRAGRYADALGPLDRGMEMYTAIYEEAPTQDNLIPLVKARSSYGTALKNMNMLTEAKAIFLETEPFAEKMADAENYDAMLTLAEYRNMYGNCHNMSEDYVNADNQYRKATELYKKIAEFSNSDIAKAQAAISCFNASDAALKAEHYDYCEQALSEGLELLSPVKENLGSYYSSIFYAWQAYYDILFEKDYNSAVLVAWEAYNLQPDSVTALYYYSYSLLYAGYYEDADGVIDYLVSLGEGASKNILMDFDALSRYGMHLDYMDIIADRISG